MPSTAVSLTWTVEVPMQELGGNLELFETLVPGIRMLRMCNRVGQGAEAHITKLPVELVNLIEEEYILDAMKTYSPKHCREWNLDYKCWRPRCELLDHFDGAGFIEIYNAQMARRFATLGVCPCGCGKAYHDQELKDQSHLQGNHERSKCTLWATEISHGLLDFIEDLARYYPQEFAGYKKCHEDRRRSWQARTTRARLDRMEALLKAHFGLGIWVERPQWHEDQGPERGFRSYIRLPSASVGKEHSNPIELYGRHAGSDVSFAFDVTMPQLSTESAARFKRAIRLLQMTKWAEELELRLLVSSEGEGRSTNAGGRLACSEDPMSSRIPATRVCSRTERDERSTMMDEE